MNPCFLCPRHCGVSRPESRADAPSPLPGCCRSPRLPVVARAGLHFWEEPVLSGSRGAGAVFFSGCNLRCVYCQNYSISSGGSGEEISVARLREIYRELAARGAHNLDLVTPTHFADAVLASLDPAPPLPVVWNSNAYESVETLRRLGGRVAIYLPDPNTPTTNSPRGTAARPITLNARPPRSAKCSVRPVPSRSAMTACSAEAW